MGRGKEITGPLRGKNPCYGCTERFIACADHCPKDERGEFGHKAWKKEVERVNKNRREYERQLGVRIRNGKRAI